MTVPDALHRWLGRGGQSASDDAATAVGRRLVERSVVAISGGVDSGVLAVAVAEVASGLGLSRADLPILAHFQHHLRLPGEEADDLAVVREIARRTGLSVVVGEARAGEVASLAASAGGIEAAARQLRYAFLTDVARFAGARTVLTAHTASDQSETVLMRLLSGVEGPLLAGIPSERDLGGGVVVARPLLIVARAEIERFARGHDVWYVDDRTNRDVTIRRNLIRREVLPAVRTIWPAVDRDLCTLATSVDRTREAARRETESVRWTCVGRSVVIDRATFFAASRDARLMLLYRVLGVLDLIRRDDRPSHGFFRPLLGDDPGRPGTLIGARGMRIELRRHDLVVSPDIVRPPQSGYLRRGASASNR